jgi:predicted dehydrogenase
MWFSKSALGHRNGLRLRIYGSKASTEWYQACPEELVLSYADGRREIMDRASSVDVANMRRYNRFKAGHPAGFIEAFANLYSDIADCLRQYRATGQWTSENVFSAELALEGLQLIEAMVKSTDKKAWQAVCG